MDKKQLNEEIQKMIFLSKYDTSKTLDENNIISEQIVTAVAKDVKIAGGTLAKAEAEAIMKRIQNNPKAYPGLNTIDDVVKGVKAGNTAAMQAVFKTTKNPQILNAMASKFVSNTQVMQRLSQKAKDQKKSIEAYLRQSGYSDDAINAMKQADKNGTYFKVGAGKPATAGQTTGSVAGKGKTKSPSQGGPKPSPKVSQNAQKVVKQRGKKIKQLGSWAKVKPYLMGLGITAAVAALAYWLLFPNADDVTDVVNVADDSQAGDVGGGAAAGSTFRTCNDFPYTQGCRSEVVREIQNCLKTDANGNPLRADGLFGPRTAGALTKQGYATEVTKEVYDKIKANCGGTPTPGPTEEPDDVNPFAGAPSLDAEQ